MCFHFGDDVLDKDLLLVGDIGVCDADVSEIPDHPIRIVVATQLVTALVKSLYGSQEKSNPIRYRILKLCQALPTQGG